MRTTVSLLAALVLLATVPATAQSYFAQRVVTTRCHTGDVIAFKQIDGSMRRTTVGCPSWTFFDWNKMIYVTWNRPVVDLEGAIRSARVWWPACKPTWYGTTDQTVDGVKYYHWYFHVCI